MTFKENYERSLPNFLNDKSLCNENKLLFKKYFEWQERKLQSINNLRELDESSRSPR